MNTNCDIIIEPKYCIDTINNTFHDGLIVVSEIIDDFKYQYCIDHYGLIHGKMENISPEEEYNATYVNITQTKSIQTLWMLTMGNQKQAGIQIKK